ncbi:AbrB family transcriptional regulator [Macrococcus hajekii]|uniref:AbrB family transcriptional regulator n=2 Tax=Macrococcus hajekii TaxID=198482 RepID=A0A4R6BNY4_9STAP|nr:AbrB family transcriptional regulator [Macrococcus hajekii]
MKIGILLPWLFGPIAGAAGVSKITHSNIRWPKFLADAGLYILGMQIGSTFTMTVLEDIRYDLFNIVWLNIVIIAAAILLSLIYRKITGCTYETAVLSAVPDALSQMIIMAEENKRADLLAVTLSQTSRLLFVVMIVPFIASLSSNGQSGAVQHAESLFAVLSPETIIMIIESMVIVSLVLKHIHFPVPQLLGPILVVTCWNLITDLTFSIPYALITLAQLLFGIRIGLQLVELSSSLSIRLFVAIAIQNTLLIAMTFTLTLLMAHDNFNNLFLSLAPGGMAQIVIVALETGNNIAMISSYHIFRIFFILLVAAPLIQYLLKRFDNSSEIR